MRLTLTSAIRLRSRFVRNTLVLLALLGTTSCTDNPHPELRPVTGQVIYEDQPVAEALVAFYNEDSPRPATGRTDAEGNFYLSTFDDHDGALPGEHTVVITKTDLSGQEASSLSMDQALTAKPNRIKTRELLPARYGSARTSPLRFTVPDAGQSDFKIELSDSK